MDNSWQKRVFVGVLNPHPAILPRPLTTPQKNRLGAWPCYTLTYLDRNSSFYNPPGWTLYGMRFTSLIPESINRFALLVILKRFCLAGRSMRLCLKNLLSRGPSTIQPLTFPSLSGQPMAQLLISEDVSYSPIQDQESNLEMVIA